MEGAVLKSMREAKRHTTWAAPNTAYEEGMLGFVREALDPNRSAAFLDAFLPFQERIARLGFRNSLVQTALKLTLPGMPDIYQGTELWDLSLVDPDNRRPVDYGLRTGLLEEVSAALARDRGGTAAAMLEGWHDGRLKLALTATLLAHRREHPALYAEGAYEPVAASGPKADHLCAFARGHGEDALLVVAARFPARLEAEPGWGDTKLAWPQAAAGATHWRDLLSGRVVERRGGAAAAGALVGEQPVAVLAPDSSGRS
jgi:(1->4)-alpha-D-glucan 1-alpha-D-glucosylmutase